MELICTNGKRDSGTKFISPELCLPFAQTVNWPVCPCKYMYMVNNSCLLGVESACLITSSFSGFSQGCAPTCRCCISRMGWFCFKKNIQENIVVFPKCMLDISTTNSLSTTLIHLNYCELHHQWLGRFRLAAAPVGLNTCTGLNLA